MFRVDRFADRQFRLTLPVCEHVNRFCSPSLRLRWNREGCHTLRRGWGTWRSRSSRLLVDGTASHVLLQKWCFLWFRHVCLEVFGERFDYLPSSGCKLSLCEFCSAGVLIPSFWFPGLLFSVCEFLCSIPLYIYGSWLCCLLSLPSSM